MSEDDKNFYNPDDKQPVDDLPNDDSASADLADKPDGSGKTFSWQAPEFIAHHHPPAWYAALVIATIALAAAIFLITKDYVAVGTIIVLGVIIGLSAKRQPGTVSFELTNSGLSINNKKYPYNAFKSFSLIREGELTSVNFFPLKRFMPMVSAYLSQTDEDKVVKAVGNHLPYEQRQMDSMDRLSRRLRL